LPSKKNTAEKKVGDKSPVNNKKKNGNQLHKNGTASGEKKVQPVKKDIPSVVVTPKSSTKKPVKKSTPKASKPASLTIEFRLRFSTEFGQSIYILGDVESLGNMDVTKVVALDYTDNRSWSVQLELPKDLKQTITYHYILKQKDGRIDYDWGTKTFDPSLFNEKNILIIDSWNHAGYFENAFYTEPFKDVLLAKTAYTSKKNPKKITHRFSVKAPLLGEGEAVCILGAGKGFSEWNTADPILLNKKSNEDSWTVQLDLSEHDFIIEYKYGIYDTVNKQFIRYESGNNRFVQAAAKGQQVSINDGFVVLPNNTWKGAGISIPVFSLRTERSYGVGEFSDLKLLVDWAKQTGFKLVQILPVNDTSATHTWKDSYPYAAISAFALHPMFLDLDKATDEKNKHLLTEI